MSVSNFAKKKTMFGSSLPPVVCRRAPVLFVLFVFVCVLWCPIRIAYMNNMASVLSEAGTNYPSRVSGFTNGFWWGPCCSLISLVFCVVFFCLRSVSCVPYVASVSGLSILDCPLFCLSSFCVLCTLCCQCLWIVYS
jgi:hypothetical protein